VVGEIRDAVTAALAIEAALTGHRVFSTFHTEDAVGAVVRLADAIGGPLRAADCVAIEDSRWGLDSARAAGLRTVAISTSYDASELGDADLILPDIGALDMEALRAIFDS